MFSSIPPYLSGNQIVGCILGAWWLFGIIKNFSR
jgi:hypothetical protein